MAKLTEYEEAARFDKDDILIKDGTAGTKKIKASSAAAEFAGLVSAVNHRNVYRGIQIGTSVTDAQKNAIQAGTFDNMYIGDYWVINGFNWRIADMDYWYNCGDTAFTTHHLVIVPDKVLVDKVVMEDSDTTANGYTRSKMYKTTLPTVVTTVKKAFPSLVLKHREYFVNAGTDGKPSARAWVDSEVDLMNEVMVYGCHIWSVMSVGSGGVNKSTIDNSQLALFQLNPRMIKTRANYWLRDITSASNFAAVSSYGTAPHATASSTNCGVRPAFAIGVASA